MYALEMIRDDAPPRVLSVWWTRRSARRELRRIFRADWTWARTLTDLRVARLRVGWR